MAKFQLQIYSNHKNTKKKGKIKYCHAHISYNSSMKFPYTLLTHIKRDRWKRGIDCYNHKLLIRTVLVINTN